MALKGVDQLRGGDVEDGDDAVDGAARDVLPVRRLERLKQFMISSEVKQNQDTEQETNQELHLTLPRVSFGFLLRKWISNI